MPPSTHPPSRHPPSPHPHPHPHPLPPPGPPPVQRDARPDGGHRAPRLLKVRRDQHAVVAARDDRPRGARHAHARRGRHVRTSWGDAAETLVHLSFWGRGACGGGIGVCPSMDGPEAPTLHAAGSPAGSVCPWLLTPTLPRAHFARAPQPVRYALPGRRAGGRSRQRRAAGSVYVQHGRRLGQRQEVHRGEWWVGGSVE